MHKQLTPEQVAALAPYEEYFGTAIRSGYCSHPGPAAIDKLRAVWAELTGYTYPMSAGCSTCLFNLMHDIGQLYFAAAGKDPFEIANRKVVYNSSAPASEPAPAAPTTTPKTTTPRKKASNAKK